MKAVMEGVNLSVFTYGSTGTGRSYTTQGRGADSGIVQMIGDNIFNLLDDKRYNN